MKYTVITEYDAEVMFDEYLDETYDKVKMFGSTFYPSQILNKCDPIAYDIGLSEFIDHLAENSDIYVLGINDDEKPTDEDDPE
jgi:hypothetical protein